MGLLRVFQRVQMLDPQLQFAGRDHIQDVRGALLQLFVSGNVVDQRGTRDKSDPFTANLPRSNRGTGPLEAPNSAR